MAVSPVMCRLRERIERIGEVDSNVLITGESGTGKEIVARAIHHAGMRRREKLVPINAGAIPEGLIERELFGHKRGAFTDAIADSEGLVEKADRGILFLDEVGEMSVTTQVRLLRFLDNGEFRRVGDSTIRRADVRVIAATNRPLKQAIAEGRFRLDLYYRLSVLSLSVPPLRERRDDIAMLACHFLPRIAERLRVRVTGFTPEAMLALETQPWPGNVRELQNVIESAVVLTTTDVVAEEHVRRALIECSLGAADAPRASLGEDGQNVLEMLTRFGGNHARAAEALGVSRTTLWRMQRRLAAKA